MAQHDYNVANGSGATVRSDLNNALSAIATSNSGATAPSTTFAHQLWADTTNSLLMQRNAANSAWVELGKLGIAYGLGMPSGTKVLFQQTAAPTGWTKDTTHNDKALRVVSGTVGSGGATAFATVFGSGKVTGAKTLAIADIPAHTHPGSTARGGNTAVGTSNSSTTANAGNLSFTVEVDVASQGGGGAHDHTLSLDLQYVDVIVAAKD